MIDENVGTKLEDIQFPEFTANLIGSTFDALISANLRQMTAYMELVEKSQETLSDFINNTKDDISGDEALAFLERILPAPGGDKTNTTLVRTGSELSESEATRLTTELDLEKPDDESIQHITVSKGEISEDTMSEIIDAVAQRLAFNKYDTLQKIVNQGILRLVVERGEIETRLNFEAYKHEDTTRKTTDYQRSNYRSSQSNSRGFFSTAFLGPKKGASTTTKLHVKTYTGTNSDSEGTTTNVSGSVKLYFKTDYLPLVQED